LNFLLPFPATKQKFSFLLQRRLNRLIFVCLLFSSAKPSFFLI
jgi:hypothetical protein